MASLTSETGGEEAPCRASLAASPATTILPAQHFREAVQRDASTCLRVTWRDVRALQLCT